MKKYAILAILISAVWCSVGYPNPWNGHQSMSPERSNYLVTGMATPTPTEDCSGAVGCWKMNDASSPLVDVAPTGTPVPLVKNASGSPAFSVTGSGLGYDTGVTFAGGEVFVSAAHASKLDLGNTTDVTIFFVESAMPNNTIFGPEIIYGSCTGCSESFALFRRQTTAPFDMEYYFDMSSEETGFNQGHCSAHATWPGGAVPNQTIYEALTNGPHTVEVRVDRSAKTCEWFVNGIPWGPTGYSVGWNGVAQLRVNGVRPIAIGADDRGGAPPLSPYNGTIFFLKQVNAIP